MPSSQELGREQAADRGTLADLRELRAANKREQASIRHELGLAVADGKDAAELEGKLDELERRAKRLRIAYVEVQGRMRKRSALRQQAEKREQAEAAAEAAAQLEAELPGFAERAQRLLELTRRAVASEQRGASDAGARVSVTTAERVWQEHATVAGLLRELAAFTLPRNERGMRRVGPARLAPAEPMDPTS